MKKEILQLLFKRIFTSAIVLFLLISFLFFLLRLSPGDPSLKFISPDLSPKLAAKVRESFNLNSSLVDQYKTFIINLVRGNFGISYTYRIPVLSVIKDYLPFTLIFSSISFLIQIFAGFFLALVSVKKINGAFDKTISKLSLIVYAIPSFVLGVSLILVFSSALNLLPSSGLSSFDSGSFSFFQRLSDYAVHLVLPLITLSLSGVAVYYKYLRENLEDVYNKTFVLNLRSNGFTEKGITRKHVIPNAINPLISVAGVELGLLFSGALVTEVIFGLPGMGRLTVNAILLRDYPLVVGCTFVSGVLVIFSNLVADLIKVKLDKRLLKGVLN
ncbi:MAG: ABC transporter permease [Ignavibacteriaceae bacterium]